MSTRPSFATIAGNSTSSSGADNQGRQPGSVSSSSQPNGPFGMPGLLCTIKVSDPEVSSFSLGLDLSSLGLDLTSSE